MSEGFAVMGASSGADALLYVQQRQLPDLIITDFAMSGMDGLELCKRLRVYPATRCVPIILYTGTIMSPRSWLYDRSIAKPADLKSFASDIRTLLAAAPL